MSQMAKPGLGKTLCLWLLVLIPLRAVGQNQEKQEERAFQLYAEHRFQEASVLFENLLKTDSLDIDLLNAQANCLAAQSYPGLSEPVRNRIYQKAYVYARRAVRLNPKNAMALYNVGLALGRLSEGAPTKVKIEYARRIRESCEESHRLNPALPMPLHILGRWHREVAGFSALEKKMLTLFYGNGLEGGSYEQAISYFTMAMKLDPHNPIHYYEMGLTYLQRGGRFDSSYAKAYLKKAVEMPLRFPEDEETRRKALRKLKTITD